jgi:hypothetical protein
MMVRDDMSVADEIDWLAPKKRNGKPELVAQRAVVKWLRMVLPAGSEVIHIPNEAKGAAPNAMARARFGMARKASGVVPGTPDLVCVLPGGRTAWIEMKADKVGTISEAQQSMHRLFRAAGHQVGIATCIETARWLMHGWQIPLREAPGQPMRPAVVRVAKAKPRLASDPMPF